MATTRLTVLESGFALGGWVPRTMEAGVGLTPPFVGNRDRQWMARALLTAMEGIGLSSPNPSVGAIIVKGDRCLGQGYTQTYGSFHAERMALCDAQETDVRGAECFVTLEPCGALGGKQSPCADALIHAGIGRVIVAAVDPHPKAAGSGLDKLSKAGISVELNCLAAEAKAWHFPFLAHQQKKSPIIFGKWAQTLDGHLADDQGRSQWISGPRSRAYTHWLRQKYDAIMIGVNTLAADRPKLTSRDSAPPHARHPHKILFDPSARLSQASSEALEALFDSTSPLGPIVYWCTGSSLIALPKVLEAFSDRLVHIPSVDPLDFPRLWQSLQTKHFERFGHDLQSIMVEGGSQLLTLLMRADQLDACHVFVRVGFLGGSRNRIARMDKGHNPSVDLMQRHDYKLIATQQIDDEVLIECVHRRYDFWP